MKTDFLPILIFHVTRVFVVFVRKTKKTDKVGRDHCQIKIAIRELSHDTYNLNAQKDMPHLY